MEGLEYYDEDRMNNEMNHALNYDYEYDFHDSYDDYPEYEGLLSNDEVESLKSTYEELEVYDFKKIKGNVIFNVVEYKGWSKFFGDYIKLHLVISKEYYTFCVMKINAAGSTIKMLVDNELKLQLNYKGIKINSRDEEYPSLILSFKFPD